MHLCYSTYVLLQVEHIIKITINLSLHHHPEISQNTGKETGC